MSRSMFSAGGRIPVLQVFLATEPSFKVTVPLTARLGTCGFAFVAFLHPFADSIQLGRLLVFGHNINW